MISEKLKKILESIVRDEISIPVIMYRKDLAIMYFLIIGKLINAHQSLNNKTITNDRIQLQVIRYIVNPKYIFLFLNQLKK